MPSTRLDCEELSLASLADVPKPVNAQALYDAPNKPVCAEFFGVPKPSDFGTLGEVRNALVAEQDPGIITERGREEGVASPIPAKSAHKARPNKRSKLPPQLSARARPPCARGQKEVCGTDPTLKYCAAQFYESRLSPCRRTGRPGIQGVTIALTENVKRKYPDERPKAVGTVTTSRRN
jgi:hypothetical protein